MPRLKYFNDSTQEWEYVVVGGQGPQGDPGPGIAAGGTAGQIIAKVDGTDYNTEWIDNYTEQVKHTVKAGESLTKGQAVYVSSANGTNMIVSKASNSGESTSSKTMGLIAQTLANNDQGFVITEGLLAGLNTASATAGDPVWLGTSGNLIYGLSNKPTAPAHLVFIGIVTRVHATNGEIFVKIQNGFELDELHDVSITSPAAGELVVRNSANTLWENMTKSEAGFATVATSGSYNDLSDKPITASSGQVLYQNGSNATVGSSGLVYDGVSLKVNGNLESTYASGDEGGEIFLNKPATNTSIASGVTIDVWQNNLRIFENGGSNRGYRLDLTRASSTVGTNLIPGLSPIVPSSVTVGSGSASISADGTVTFTSCNYFDLSNVFSSIYANYKVIFETVNVTAGDTLLAYVLLNNGSANGSNFTYQRIYAQNTTVGTALTSGQTAGGIGVITGLDCSAELNIFRPNKSQYTSSQSQCIFVRNESGVMKPFIEMFYSTLADTTQYNGVRFYDPAGSISGKLKVYGYN